MSLSITRVSRFYKSNQSKPLIHPLRRWVPFYVVGGVVGGLTGYGVIHYFLTKREAARYGDQEGRYMCSTTTVDFLTLLPFNLVSHVLGILCGDAVLPPSVHQYLIRWITWYYGMAIPPGATYNTLQEFYARPWGLTERIVSPTASFVSPCDGEVLSVMENVKGDELLQVKGCSYSVRSLFRLPLPDPPQPHFRRTLIVVKLRVQDYHHVIAPIQFQCEGSVYVPGALFPISQAWYHSIPGVLTLNERVIVHGNSAGSPVYLALVGSTLTGNIKLAFDGRVRTNFLDPPDYSIFTKYKSKPLIAKGDAVGAFHWGSTVVVMADIPESTSLSIRPGSILKAGEALTT